MDNLNENPNEYLNEIPDESSKPTGCLSRFTKTIKVIVIGLLILLLMIPVLMIQNQIEERGRTQVDAINEVSQKWSLAQTITGPYISLPYPTTVERDGKKETSIENLILFPDELQIDGQLKTETLKRSIYEVNVYQSELILKGSFSAEELIKSRINTSEVPFDGASI